MKDIVKFEINTPVEVTLQDEAGKRVEGRYGEQVMYSLLDDRVMYVPLYVEQRFKELAIGAGEPLLLCKQEVQDGNRNRIQWSVMRAPHRPNGSASGTNDKESALSVTATAPLLVGLGGEREGPAGTEVGDAAEHQPAINKPTRQEEQPSGNS